MGGNPNPVMMTQKNKSQNTGIERPIPFQLFLISYAKYRGFEISE
jgi:hypothetical protein